MPERPPGRSVPLDPHGRAAADPELRLAEIARRQHGVVRCDQAITIGVTPSTIARRADAGRWKRVSRGIYRIGPIAAPLEWAAATVLAMGPDARFSHSSAAFLHGWLGAAPLPRPIHITVERRRPRGRHGVVAHATRSLEPDEVDRCKGFPVTAAGRTLIDLAPTLPARDFEQVVARVLRDNVLSIAQLHRIITRYRGRPGIGRLRRVVRQEGGPRFTRSEAEMLLLDLLRTAEIPLPQTNFRVGAFELDAVWTRERLAVEIDGYEFHRSRASFEADRLKDAWLMDQGYRVIRITWRQLADHSLRTAVLIGRALVAAASPP